MDLLKHIFVYDPTKRIKAYDALKHQWFNETIRDEGIQAELMRQEKEEELERRRRRRIDGGDSDTEEEIDPDDVDDESVAL